MTCFIGIDPGQSGGMAIVNAKGVLADVIPMPVIGKEVDGQLIMEVLTTWWTDSQDRCRVIIEEVHSMPKQGVATTFKFGKNYGIAIGVVQACGIPYEFVRPQEWKKTFTLVGKDKDASRMTASQLWPSMKEKWRLKNNDGLAEAALMAEHGRRNL